MTRAGTCAICKKALPVGTNVYFDATKSQGNHLVHILCFKNLMETRGRLPKDPKAPKPTVKSTEPLDPPF